MARRLPNQGEEKCGHSAARKRHAAPEVAPGGNPHFCDIGESENQMTPWGIIIASMVILAADYFVVKYLRSSHSRKVWVLLASTENPWLKNPFRSKESRVP